VVFHRIAGVGEPPPGRLAFPEGGLQPGRGKPVEIFDYDVVTEYNANPFSVKKMASNAWAQYVWEMHGGEGIHPLAWRVPGSRVVFVNEARWPTARLAEINQPHELFVPGQGTQPPPRPQADPQAPTVAPPAPEPPAPAPDPLAPTGVMPPPRSGPVTAITGPKGQAVEASPGDAVAAYQANPGAVYVGRNSVHHEQIWHLSGGRGATPVVFRSGNAYFVDPELAPPGLLAQIGRAMQLPAVAAPAVPQRPATVTVEFAVQSGLVSPTGNLGRVLQGIQTEYAAAAPKNLNEGLAVVTRGAARAGLHPGRRTQPSATEYQLENVGGVRTRILASGEIIVTNRDGQVVLHLIP
jgi:hypothetical protein